VLNGEYLNAGETRYRLNIGPGGLKDCVRLGLLTPAVRQTRECYAVTDIEAFEARYVPRLVVANQLGITPSQLRWWVGCGQLHTIRLGACNYYEKSEVTKLKKFLAEHVYMAAAVRECSVDLETIRRAVKRGAIIPVRMGGLCFVARADVDNLVGYTRAQVAALLGISPKNVTRLAGKGFFGGDKLPSGRWRYTKPAVEHFFNIRGSVPVYLRMKKAARSV
jgi:hypothetical protein